MTGHELRSTRRTRRTPGLPILCDGRIAAVQGIPFATAVAFDRDALASTAGAGIYVANGMAVRPATDDGGQDESHGDP